jgi:hypothetical protein
MIVVVGQETALGVSFLTIESEHPYTNRFRMRIDGVAYEQIPTSNLKKNVVVVVDDGKKHVGSTIEFE